MRSDDSHLCVTNAGPPYTPQHLWPRIGRIVVGIGRISLRPWTLAANERSGRRFLPNADQAVVRSGNISVNPRSQVLGLARAATRRHGKTQGELKSERREASSANTMCVGATLPHVQLSHHVHSFLEPNIRRRRAHAETNRVGLHDPSVRRGIPIR